MLSWSHQDDGFLQITTTKCGYPIHIIFPPTPDVLVRAKMDDVGDMGPKINVGGSIHNQIMPFCLLERPVYS